MDSSPSAASGPAAVSSKDAALVSTSGGGGGGGSGGNGACEPGKLFVGGIPWDATEGALREHFGKYGEVTEAIIMKDRGTGNARGFGFVSFADPSAADRAIQDAAAKHAILGRPVEVKRAIPRGEQHQSLHQCYNGYQHHNRVSSKGSSRVTDGQTRTKKIFVGGLSASLTQEEFKSHFERFGRITDVVVMYDSSTQRPRGFGFITFESEESVDNAVQNTFQTLRGKTVEVKRAVPREGNNDSNNCNKSSYNRGGYNTRIGNGRGSIFENYPGGIYPPYSPRFGGYHGYSVPPYSPYIYGTGGYGEGYGFGAYGVGYGSPYASPRGAWNGYGYLGARRSPLPYAAAGFYPGYLNGGVNPHIGVGAGGFHGFVPSANGKLNQSDSDLQVQTVNGSAPSPVENATLNDQQSSDC